ncbi:MAG: diguanylate cyclase [Conexibacter sp.]|nr:diguanylate cyclase [Conexibacter sp.]
MVAVASVYALAASLTLATPMRGGVVAVWPAAGIALACLTRGGIGLWPGVLLGAFVAQAAGDQGPAAALGCALAETAGVVVCVALMDRFVRPIQRGDVRRFVGIVVLAVAAGATAVIGQTGLWMQGEVLRDDWGAGVLRWALADLAGMLLLGPMLLGTGGGRLRLRLRLQPLRVAEDVAAAGLLLGAAEVIFRHPQGQIWLLIPLGVWLVLRASALTISLASIGLTIIAVRLTAQGHGPLAVGGEPHVTQAQAFAVMMSACLYLLCELTSDRSRMLEEHRRLSDEAASLRRVATAVAGGVTPQDVAELAAREVATLMQLDVGVVVAFQPGSDIVRCVGQGAADGVFAPALPPQTAIAPGSAIDRLRRSGIAERFDERGAAVLTMPPFTQRVAAPIVTDARLWGALIVCTAREDDLPDDAEQRLQRFAELMGMAIANADAQARLIAQATTDQLTGLVNHRAFHERLREEAAAAQRQGRELSLAVFDIDRFKQVNDTLGHVGGDAVLAETARRMTAASRTGEIVARIGGDELALLMPGVGGEVAHAAAERVRRAVAAAPFPDAGVITLSAGVCDLTQAAEPEELLRLADGALYWAKAHGRDASIRYTPQVVEELSADERADRLENARALAALGALAKAIDAKDPATIRHSERVAALAWELAAESGWSSSDVARLHDAALVHDVGKIGVPDAVLSKPGRLSDEEYDVIKRHADLGARIVAGVLDPEQVAWVRGHHERHDGRGYPDGLAGDQITEGAWLLALADGWDAMTGARVYSDPMSLEAALDEVRRHAGTQFHPDAVAALERLDERGALEALTGEAGAQEAVPAGSARLSA